MYITHIRAKQVPKGIMPRPIYTIMIRIIIIEIPNSSPIHTYIPDLLERIQHDNPIALYLY